MKSMKFWGLLGLFACVVVLVGMQGGMQAKPDPNAATDDPVIDQGRLYVQQFYRGELAGVYDRFSLNLRNEMPLSQLQKIHEGVEEQLGRETAVVSETSVRNGEVTEYRRLARFERQDRPVTVMFAMRDDGSIAAFYFEREKSGGSDG